MLFVFFLCISKLNHVITSFLADVHREARTAARGQTENFRHIFCNFSTAFNVLLNASVGAHGVIFDLFLLRESIGFSSNHFVECKNTSSLTKVYHLENMSLRWKLSKTGTTDRNLLNVIGNLMTILIHRYNRLDFVHRGQTDISKAEDAIINDWSGWLTFFDQWVLVCYLTLVVDKDLTSFFVKALS